MADIAFFGGFGKRWYTAYMTNQEIAQWLKNTYEKSLKSGAESHQSGLSRSKGTQGTIFLQVDGKTHSITKNTLADELGNDDELASQIWNWIHP